MSIGLQVEELASRVTSSRARSSSRRMTPIWCGTDRTEVASWMRGALSPARRLPSSVAHWLSPMSLRIRSLACISQGMWRSAWIRGSKALRSTLAASQNSANAPRKVSTCR